MLQDMVLVFFTTEFPKKPETYFMAKRVLKILNKIEYTAFIRFFFVLILY